MELKLDKLLGEKVCVVFQVCESAAEVYGTLEESSYYMVEAPDGGRAMFYAYDVTSVNVEDKIITIAGIDWRQNAKRDYS